MTNLKNLQLFFFRPVFFKANINRFFFFYIIIKLTLNCEQTEFFFKLCIHVPACIFLLKIKM